MIALEALPLNNPFEVYMPEKWLALLRDVHGYRVFNLGSGGKACFPLAMVKSVILGNRLISLPFADYGGALPSSEEGVAALVGDADRLARELKVDFLEIRAPHAAHHEIFHKCGFKKRDDYITYILSLDPALEDLWAGIGVKNRNMVRKAEKNMVQIREASGRDDLDDFFRVYLKTMKRLGSPPQPYRFFERLWDFFYLENLFMPMAVFEGRCIAAGLYLVGKHNIHHAYSCYARDFSPLAPNNLIQWHAIKWAKQSGLKYFNFGRTREKAGNQLFKRRWGGEPVPMPYYYKFYHKELKERQEVKYQFLARIWSRFVPGAVARCIGPWLIRQVG